MDRSLVVGTAMFAFGLFLKLESMIYMWNGRRLSREKKDYESQQKFLVASILDAFGLMSITATLLVYCVTLFLSIHN